MSESPEPTTGSTPATAPQPSAPAQSTQQKPYWLYRFAAWVVIVAGIVFVAGSIFFAGAALTDRGESHCHHHGHHHAMGHPGHHHRGHGPGAPWMHGHGPGGPGMDGGPGANDLGPGQPPQSATPTPPGR